ncbi:MAG: hypothetical protein J6T10_27670 [Methanobrevibacter sp.]|nr:hypothetical protein [Methanobrevibacter sp.]
MLTKTQKVYAILRRLADELDLVYFKKGHRDGYNGELEPMVIYTPNKAHLQATLDRGDSIIRHVYYVPMFMWIYRDGAMVRIVTKDRYDKEMAQSFSLNQYDQLYKTIHDFKIKYKLKSINDRLKELNKDFE